MKKKINSSENMAMKDKGKFPKNSGANTQNKKFPKGSRRKEPQLGSIVAGDRSEKRSYAQ